MGPRLQSPDEGAVKKSGDNVQHVPTPNDMMAMPTDRYAGDDEAAFCAGVSVSQLWSENRTAVHPKSLERRKQGPGGAWRRMLYLFLVKIYITASISGQHLSIAVMTTYGGHWQSACHRAYEVKRQQNPCQGRRPVVRKHCLTLKVCAALILLRRLVRYD